MVANNSAVGYQRQQGQREEAAFDASKQTRLKETSNNGVCRRLSSLHFQAKMNLDRRRRSGPRALPYVNPFVRWSSPRTGQVLRIRAAISDFSRDCGIRCACRHPTGKAIEGKYL